MPLGTHVGTAASAVRSNEAGVSRSLTRSTNKLRKPLQILLKIARIGRSQYRGCVSLRLAGQPRRLSLRGSFPPIIFSMAGSPKDVQKKIESLREKIRHHEHLYYVLDNPEISDAEFDKLMQQLQQLEAEHPTLITPDSPTQRVGGKPREGFVKVRHSSPMLSLDNTYSEDELRAWERRVHEVSGRA